MNQTSCNKSHTKDQNNLTNQISYFGDYLILSESIQSYNQSLAQETRPNTSKNRSHKRIETIITSTTTKLEIDPYHAQGSGDTPLFLEDDERIEDEESKLKVNKTDDEDLVERGVCLYTMEKLGLNFMNMEEVPILFFFSNGEVPILMFPFSITSNYLINFSLLITEIKIEFILQRALFIYPIVSPFYTF